MRHRRGLRKEVGNTARATAKTIIITWEFVEKMKSFSECTIHTISIFMIGAHHMRTAGRRKVSFSTIYLKTDKSKTSCFWFGGNKKLQPDRPNLFLAKCENLRRDWN
jgi:hypothetical protein